MDNPTKVEFLTVERLIDALKRVDKNAVVALSVDEEGNHIVPMLNIAFWSENYVDLNAREFEILDESQVIALEAAEDQNLHSGRLTNLQKVVVLWPAE